MSKQKEVIDEMNLSLDSVFIPWSQSRNKGEKYPSLNWKVSLKKDGKDILTTDYMAGCGHCPSYQQKESYESRQAVKLECESGFEARETWSSGNYIPDKKKPILPELENVVWCFLLDSEVIDYDFKDWCANFGYDEDSIKANNIYKECMEVALKMIRSLGSENLEKLRVVFQDY